MKFYRIGILYSLVENPPPGGTLKDKYMLGGTMSIRFNLIHVQNKEK